MEQGLEWKGQCPEGSIIHSCCTEDAPVFHVLHLVAHNKLDALVLLTEYLQLYELTWHFSGSYSLYFKFCAAIISKPKELWVCKARRRMNKHRVIVIKTPQENSILPGLPTRITSNFNASHFKEIGNFLPLVLSYHVSLAGCLAPAQPEPLHQFIKNK